MTTPCYQQKNLRESEYKKLKSIYLKGTTFTLGDGQLGLNILSMFIIKRIRRIERKCEEK
jgi:hypothetical protein